MVFRVVDHKENPHPLDDRVLWWLHLGDTWRYKSRDEYVKRLQDYEDFIKARQKADFEDEIEHTARSDFLHIAPHIFTPHKWFGEQ